MSATGQSPINVALAFDDAYAAHGSVVIASAVRHLAPGSARFLCLHDGLGEARRKQVEAAAPGFEILWHEVRPGDMPELTGKGYLSRVTLFRLGLHRFAPPDWSRVIYLDSDIIVDDDLGELWRLDLGGKPIAAVPDIYQDHTALVKRFGLDPSADGMYFNAGVLVIDLESARRTNDLATGLALLVDNGFDLDFLDQDALNVVFWNRWARINPAWNVQRYMSRSDPGRSLWAPHTRPAIIHYITGDKPWKRDVWHPWAGAYWTVLHTTSFAREVIARYGVTRHARLRIWFRYWMSHVR
jgi:lipopolysaccharide biosynthesis glycosyltransferase